MAYINAVDNPAKKREDEQKGLDICPFAYGVKPINPCPNANDPTNFNSKCLGHYAKASCFRDMIFDLPICNPEKTERAPISQSISGLQKLSDKTIQNTGGGLDGIR